MAPRLLSASDGALEAPIDRTSDRILGGATLRLGRPRRYSGPMTTDELARTHSEPDGAGSRPRRGDPHRARRGGADGRRRPGPRDRRRRPRGRPLRDEDRDVVAGPPRRSRHHADRGRGHRGPRGDGRHPPGPGETRRNVTTRGIRLNDLVGRRFRVGDARLRGDAAVRAVPAPDRRARQADPAAARPPRRPASAHPRRRRDRDRRGVAPIG